MPAGFLYVLINPSMPGLAKVGKTTRNPTDRVAELSSATGVPSPFMLAFQQPVAECDAAELWVHRELEREGFRHANNREFFNAPLHEIIKVVSQASNLVFEAINDSGTEFTNFESNPDDLAEELFNLGCAYQQGTDCVLRSDTKALEHFEQAAALGHVAACSFAASIYHRGDGGVRQDLEKALSLYNRGVQLGNWRNEASIAEIFQEANQRDAAQAHWNIFFERACNEDEGEPNESLSNTLGFRGFQYCDSVASGHLAHCIPDSSIARFAIQILDFIDMRISELAQESDKFTVEYMEKRLGNIRRFVEEKLSRKELVEITAARLRKNLASKNI
jgi:hypothetical protein